MNTKTMTEEEWATAEMAKFTGESSDAAQVEEEGDEESEEDEGVEEEGDEADDQGAEEDEEEEGAEEEDDEAPPAKPKKRSVSQRIAELTRQMREAERRAAEAERRLQEKAQPPAKPAAAEDKEPNAEDFEFGELDSGYLRAVVKWEAKQALRQEDARRAQAAADQAAAQQRETWEQRISAPEVAARYADFHEKVVEGAKDGKWALSPTMGRLVLASEHGPDVAYHLASDPAEAARVAGLSDLEQAAYFGRVEARFSVPADTTSAPKRKVVSKAPKPLARQARGAGGKLRASPSTKNFAEFEALAAKEME